MDYLRERFRQNSAAVMSFCIQQVNVGHGLLQELFGVREGAPGTERAGE